MFKKCNCEIEILMMKDEIKCLKQAFWDQGLSVYTRYDREKARDINFTISLILDYLGLKEVEYPSKKVLEKKGVRRG